MTNKERRQLEARALAVGLPRNASLQEVEAEEIAKGVKPKNETNNSDTVVSSDKEEETKKIFNLSETPLTDTANAAPNKKVERNPVKAWGQK